MGFGAPGTGCHALGIPARIVHLFYSDCQSGHTIAEFHAGGRWVMADASYIVVFPGPDGELMSAAQCHEKANHDCIAAAYRKRLGEIGRLPDKEFRGGAKEAEAFRAGASRCAKYISSLGCFAVINHPWPP